MDITLIGDSLTAGHPGVPYVPMLENALKPHTIHNLAVGGESVVTAFRRVEKLPDAWRTDVALVWVGVNDVFAAVSPTFPAFRIAAGQPWADDVTEFRDTYDRLLTHVAAHAVRVLALAPLALGEDRVSEWNARLDERSSAIRELCENRPGCRFADPRDRLFALVHESAGEGYLAHSVTGVAADVFVSLSEAAIDRRSAQRGLAFTIDGVHLNSAGAAEIASFMAEEIGCELRELEGSA